MDNRDAHAIIACVAVAVIVFAALAGWALLRTEKAESSHRTPPPWLAEAQRRGYQPSASELRAAAQQENERNGATEENTRFLHAVVGAKTLRARMRNPDAFRLAQVLVMSDGSACYQYRGQNGFGGMNVGYATYPSNGDDVLSLEQVTGRKLWNSYCAKKNGLDKTWEVNWALEKLSAN